METSFLLDFVVMSLAAFRMTRFVVTDFLVSDLRNKLFDRFPPESTKTGYFFTCPWCVGFWLSLLVFSCYTIVPLQTLWVCCVFALSTVVGWLSALDNRL